MNRAMREAIQESFRRRPCFICEKRTHCRHREMRVEMAVLSTRKKPPGELEPVYQPAQWKPNSIVSVLARRLRVALIVNGYQ
jgi:hypothetical protein